MVDRGTCTFVIKVKACQDAGAIAVIVADSLPGCPPADLGGADPTITIPSVRVTQADGITLKGMLAAGLNVTLIKDPSQLAGADPAGHVQVYTPSTFAGGSSVSHWDVTANPNLLMEPAINSDLTTDVDLTLQHFADIGWLDTPVPALAAVGNVAARQDGVRIEWVSSVAQTRTWTLYRREEGQAWTAVGVPTIVGENLIVAEDKTVSPGTTYGYRIGSPGAGGIEEFSPDVWVTVPAGLGLALAGSLQNPSSSKMTLAFTLASNEPARITLTNVAGRIIHSEDLADHSAGAHVYQLASGTRLSPGVYFIRLSQASQSVTKSAVVVE
jgi:hypothetical protein